MFNWLMVIVLVCAALIVVALVIWVRRGKDEPQAGVPIKWCRALKETKAQNHIGRCTYDGKFCNFSKGVCRKDPLRNYV